VLVGVSFGISTVPLSVSNELLEIDIDLVAGENYYFLLVSKKRRKQAWQELQQAYLPVKIYLEEIEEYLGLESHYFYH
jgi:hypothetical protein|tara:strand:- start:166 stop:399 length:234 start_codon:yes stop_codon:yes gene_type:complete